MRPPGVFTKRLYAIICLLPEVAMGGSAAIQDHLDSDNSNIDAEQGSDQKQKTIEQQIDIFPDPISISTVEEKLLVDRRFEMTRANLDGSPGKRYVAYIELDRLIWPGRGNKIAGASRSHISVGLRHPYYTFDDAMRLAGQMDLEFRGSVVGIGSRAIFTLGYDMRRLPHDKSIRISVSLAHIIFKVDLPIGNR